MEPERTKIISSEDGRFEIKNAIMSINTPLKIIAPYGYSFKTNPNTKIIMTHPNHNRTFAQAKYSNKIHIKLIIGVQDNIDAAIFGSCNFTSNSVHNMHEIIIITTKKEDIDKLNSIFDKIWSRINSHRGILNVNG